MPTDLSEAIIDHDYTLVAIQRYVDGSRGFWGNVITGAKKVDKMVLQPLVAFQRTELKNFKVRQDYSILDCFMSLILTAISISGYQTSLGRDTTEI